MRTHYCGLYYTHTPDRKAFPLDGVHVSARIVDLVAEVQIMQFYVNSESIPVDAEYVFPLDESAAVCGFEAEITAKDKLLIGEVREKQEARREYNAAINRGETAALLEQDKTDIFRQKIGNIPPHSRVNIRITYVTDLKVEADGAIRFLLPTTVAPRYSPHSTYLPFPRPWHHCCGRRVWYGGYKRWKRVPYHELPFCRYRWIPERYCVPTSRPCAFSISVEVETASDIVNLECPTHDVKWQYADDGNKKQVVTSLWYDTEPLGKDFVLRVHQQAAHEPRVHVEVAPDGSAAAMLTMVPDFDLEPEATEIVFLVDCSGSMSGSRMEAAKRAMRVFLQSLPMSCHFNIIKFGTNSVDLFPSGSQAYTHASLQKALDFANRTSANLGGTEILRPLKKIFGKQVAGGGRARQVFCLTDGQVGNTEAVIECCRQNAHNSRVFTLGIGNAVSRQLVEGMARAADGTAEFIVGDEMNASSPKMEMKLINQLKIATMPAISKVMVDWGLLGAQTPPSYEFVTQNDTAAVADATTGAATTGAATTGATGETTLVSLTVECADTVPGEEIYLLGSIKALGQWDPSKAAKMVTHEGQFPVWSGSAVFPEGEQVEFKFIKKNAEGYAKWEDLEDNRCVTVRGLETAVACGKFGVASVPKVTVTRTRPSPPNAAPPATAPSAPPSNSVGSGPQPGPMRAGPSAGSKGVSKFFSAGPQAKKLSGSLMGHRSGGHSMHGVGGGAASAALHNASQPSYLAQRVGFDNDASHHQAHGRNDSIYQAPFLPPPIFSGHKFLFFAFFAPGQVPTDKVTVHAESPEGPLELEVPVSKIETVGRTVHVLAARALIRDLDEGQSHLHFRFSQVPPQERSKTHGYWWKRPKNIGGKGQDKATAWNLSPVTPPVGAVKREMVDLGVQYQLVSSETSFVAVERWLDGRPGDADMPLDLPSMQEATVSEEAPLLQAQMMYSRSRSSMSKSKKKSAPTSNFRSVGGGSPRSNGGGGGGSRPGGRGPVGRGRGRGRGGPGAPSRGARLSRRSGPPRPSPGASCGPPPGPPPSFGAVPSYGAPVMRGPPMGGPPMMGAAPMMGGAPPSYGAVPERKKEAYCADNFSDDDEESDVCASDLYLSASNSNNNNNNNNNNATVQDLINLQQFNGSFILDAKLAAMSGKSIADLNAAFDKLDIKPLTSKDEAKKIWAIAVALAIFEQRFSSASGAWAMVAEKAKSAALSLFKSGGVSDRKVARVKLDAMVSEAKAAL